MRVVVLGATGNVGTSILAALARDAAVESVLGVARRLPELDVPKVEWTRADIASDELVSLFRGADAVVHLAWVIQPARDLTRLRRINVDGSARVFRAVADAGVPALVYASSVGAYSPGPKETRVGEDWPTGGVPTSFYSRHKVQVERLLDGFEHERPDIRVVRLRPGLIFKREAASGIRRLFAGPFLPSPRYLRVVPEISGLRFQAVHSLDAGDAYRLAVVRDVRGAFNIVAEPVLDTRAVARVLGALTVPLTARAARAAAVAAYRLHLHPTPPGWFDLALQVPLLDATRAREELGWEARIDADAALRDLLAGLRERAGLDTPPLDPSAGGPLRVRELATGVGSREG